MEHVTKNRWKTLTMVTLLVAIMVAGVYALFQFRGKDPNAVTIPYNKLTTSIGQPTAPVNVLMITDPLCPPCKKFHEDVFARLKQKYIDTGKVRLYSSHLGGNQASMPLVLLGRLLYRLDPDPNAYFSFMHELYNQQETLATFGSGVAQAMTTAGQDKAKVQEISMSATKKLFEMQIPLLERSSRNPQAIAKLKEAIQGIAGTQLSPEVQQAMVETMGSAMTEAQIWEQHKIQETPTVYVGDVNIMKKPEAAKADKKDGNWILLEKEIEKQLKK